MDVDPTLLAHNCRLCLSNDPTNLFIFSDVGQKYDFQAKFLKLFRFWVRPDDTLPKYICCTCYNQVEKFHCFVLKVEDCQRKLGSLVNGQDLEIYDDSQQSQNTYEFFKNECELSTFEQETFYQTNSESNYHFSVPETPSGPPQEVTTSTIPLLEIPPSDAASAIEKLKIKSEEIKQEITPVAPNTSLPKPQDNDEAEKVENIPLAQRKQKPVKEESSKKAYGTRIKSNHLAKFYGYECQICKQNGKEVLKFRMFGQLCEHYTTAHGQRGYVICCGRKIYSRKSVRTHFLKHQKPELFKCDLCGKQLANKFCLETHKLRHRPERPFKCTTCGKGLATSGDLYKHEQQHWPEEDRLRYVCDTCGKRFKHIANLNYHRNAVHLKITEICHICAKTFASRSGLEIHMMSHEATEHQVQCTECGKWMKNKLTMRTHMKSHQDAVVFPCPYCDRVYKVNSRLSMHIKSHSDARPHQCHYCSKSFKLKSTLKTHLVQHTGEKPFQCPHCPRTFASGANFYTHKKRMHGDSAASAAARNTNPPTSNPMISTQLPPSTPNNSLEARVQAQAKPTPPPPPPINNTQYLCYYNPNPTLPPPSTVNAQTTETPSYYSIL